MFGDQNLYCGLVEKKVETLVFLIKCGCLLQELPLFRNHCLSSSIVTAAGSLLFYSSYSWKGLCQLMNTYGAYKLTPRNSPSHPSHTSMGISDLEVGTSNIHGFLKWPLNT